VSYIQALILGLLQGLTEFLPISSSAHIEVLGRLLQWGDPGAAFTAIIQLGTEAAVTIYFWRDIVRIITKWFRQWGRGNGVTMRDPDVRLGWLVILGTIPIGVVGLLAKDWIESEFRSLWLVALVLILFGVLLWLADVLGRRVKPLETMTYRDGIWVGIAQVLALVPGVSRSGATTGMALALGYTRPAAARYSFLIAIPAVWLSGLFELVNALKGDTGTTGGQVLELGWGETALATVVAFVIGYAVVAWFMRWISTRTFLPFILYRIALGIVLLVLLATGALAAI